MRGFSDLNDLPDGFWFTFLKTVHRLRLRITFHHADTKCISGTTFCWNSCQFMFSHSNSTTTVGRWGVSPLSSNHRADHSPSQDGVTFPSNLLLIPQPHGGILCTRGGGRFMARSHMNRCPSWTQWMLDVLAISAGDCQGEIRYPNEYFPRWIAREDRTEERNHQHCRIRLCSLRKHFIRNTYTPADSCEYIYECMNATACLSFVADHVPLFMATVYHIQMVNFRQDNDP